MLDARLSITDYTANRVPRPKHTPKQLIIKGFKYKKPRKGALGETPRRLSAAGERDLPRTVRHAARP